MLVVRFMLSLVFSLVFRFYIYDYLEFYMFVLYSSEFIE